MHLNPICYMLIDPRHPYSWHCCSRKVLLHDNILAVSTHFLSQLSKQSTVVCVLPKHLFSPPLYWAKLHDHTIKGHCRMAKKKLRSRELVVGHKQRLVTMSQHNLMNKLNTGLPKQSWTQRFVYVWV